MSTYYDQVRGANIPGTAVIKQARGHSQELINYASTTGATASLTNAGAPVLYTIHFVERNVQLFREMVNSLSPVPQTSCDL